MERLAAWLWRRHREHYPLTVTLVGEIVLVGMFVPLSDGVIAALMRLHPGRCSAPAGRRSAVDGRRSASSPSALRGAPTARSWPGDAGTGAHRRRRGQRRCSRRSSGQSGPPWRTWSRWRAVRCQPWPPGSTCRGSGSWWPFPRWWCWSEASGLLSAPGSPSCCARWWTRCLPSCRARGSRRCRRRWSVRWPVLRCVVSACFLSGLWVGRLRRPRGHARVPVGGAVSRLRRDGALHAAALRGSPRPADLGPDRPTSSEATVRVRHGDFAQPVPVTSPDELRRSGHRLQRDAGRAARARGAAGRVRVVRRSRPRPAPASTPGRTCSRARMSVVTVLLRRRPGLHGLRRAQSSRADGGGVAEPPVRRDRPCASRARWARQPLPRAMACWRSSARPAPGATTRVPRSLPQSRFSRRVREEFGAYLRLGIGINTGSVIAGTVGGGGRHEFTVIGDTVNVAARVEQLTKETGDAILVTEATRAACSAPRPRVVKTRRVRGPGQGEQGPDPCREPVSAIDSIDRARTLSGDLGIRRRVQRTLPGRRGVQGGSGPRRLGETRYVVGRSAGAATALG